jgi:hypothetical protein
MALISMDLNPFEKPTQYIWDVHDKLRTRLGLSASEDELNEPDAKKKAASLEMKDWLIRFLILFIDPESPFAKIRDFDDRRKQCIESLGDVKGKIPRKAMSEITKRGTLYGLIQYEFFKFVYDHDYEMWASLLSAFQTLTERLRNPNTDTDEMVKITKQIGEVRKELSELERKLFTDSRIMRQVAEEKNNQLITGYAERFAKIFE